MERLNGCSLNFIHFFLPRHFIPVWIEYGRLPTTVQILSSMWALNWRRETMVVKQFEHENDPNEVKYTTHWMTIEWNRKIIHRIRRIHDIKLIKLVVSMIINVRQNCIDSEMLMCHSILIWYCWWLLALLIGVPTVTSLKRKNQHHHQFGKESSFTINSIKATMKLSQTLMWK